MENLKESKNVAKATDVKKEVKTTGHRDPDIERASRTVERYVDRFFRYGTPGKLF